MNISKSISYDSMYSKGNAAVREINQNVPIIKDTRSFGIKLKKADNFGTNKKLESIKDAVSKSNKNLQTFDRKLDISVHEKTREVMIKVIDTTTDEVIREIPPEKVLDMIAYRKENLGILMDKKI